MDSVTTSVNLLAQLTAGVDDPVAWSRFVATYGPTIVRWCRGYGLQPSDAQDVAQEVLLQFWKQCGRFRYDPSRRFRGWLRTVVHASIVEALRRRSRQRAGPTPGVEVAALLDDVPARDDLQTRIERVYEEELLTLATAEVRGRVEPHTWAAFEALAVEGLSGEEAAERLGMKVQTVYAARHKVQKLLRVELRRLDPPE